MNKTLEELHNKYKKQYEEEMLQTIKELEAEGDLTYNYKCPYCQNIYDNQQDLSRHEMTEHLNME